MPPSFSVVMPYYNNARTLVRSLRSFAAQTCRPQQIVVVDDGAADAAAPACAGLDLGGVPLQLLRVPHGGQSAATNAGIAAATGALVYLTCPDIVAPRQVLALHAQAHAQAARDVGVMGHIRYAPWLKMTPFMRHLASDGPQFCYDAIPDAANAPPQHLYAPACSVPRAWLQRVGGFDPQFPYGFQDSDLGLRLAQAGLRFVYLAAAQVLHDHPNTLANFCARQKRVGRLAPAFAARHADVLPLATLAAGLLRCSRAAPQAATLVAQVPALEAELQAATGAPRAALRAALALRYDAARDVAFSRGLWTGGTRTRQALQLSPAAWARIGEQLRAAP